MEPQRSPRSAPSMFDMIVDQEVGSLEEKKAIEYLEVDCELDKYCLAVVAGRHGVYVGEIFCDGDEACSRADVSLEGLNIKHEQAFFVHGDNEELNLEVAI